ncbi:MAG: membrane protein insertion efficiency factor YidD [Actinomycetota bacterium]
MVVIAAIRLYRATLSGVVGGQCRFYPSCSYYGEEAVRVFGALRGSLMAARRVLRCGPFTRGGVDPVPSRFPEHFEYDHIIRMTEGSR